MQMTFIVTKVKKRKRKNILASLVARSPLKGACGKSLAFPVSTWQTGANTRLPRAGSLLLLHALSSLQQRCFARAEEHARGAQIGVCSISHLLLQIIDPFSAHTFDFSLPSLLLRFPFPGRVTYCSGCPDIHTS